MSFSVLDTLDSGVSSWNDAALSVSQPNDNSHMSCSLLHHAFLETRPVSCAAVDSVTSASSTVIPSCEHSAVAGVDLVPFPSVTASGSLLGEAQGSFDWLSDRHERRHLGCLSAREEDQTECQQDTEDSRWIACTRSAGHILWHGSGMIQCTR